MGRVRVVLFKLVVGLAGFAFLLALLEAEGVPTRDIDWVVFLGAVGTMLVGAAVIRWAWR
jgi:hypothetical protein